MEGNYGEVISDMLIQLEVIERRMTQADKRMSRFDKRLDLSIRRLVKGETRMELFDKKLGQSIREQKEFYKTQVQLNKYFLSAIKKNGHK